jgi:plasmid stabilization system protein ParE
MTLRILPEVELESAEAAAWYDDHRAGLGDDFLVEVESAIRRIGSDPRQFARLESYTGRYEVRRCVLHRFPYLIIFTCRPNEILIVAITHVRRRPLHWLERLTSQ